MPRHQLVAYEDASPGVQAIYDDFQRTTGSFTVPNWMKSLGGSEPRARAYWEMVKGALIEGELPMLLKELVLFVVSITNGSPYCAACHAHSALQLDDLLSFDDLMLLAQDIDSAHRPPSQREALKFAVKMASDPDAVTDEDFRALGRACLSSQNIAELVGVIDLAVMFNTYTKAIRLPIDPDYRPIPTDFGAAA